MCTGIRIRKANSTRIPTHTCTDSMRRPIALLFLAALFMGEARGQFQGLAPTDDGSVVYFVSSLRLQTESALKLPQTPTIYRIDASGKVERVTDPPPFNSAFPVSHGNAQVSGDRRVMSYTQVNGCVGGSSCQLTYPTTSHSSLFIAGSSIRANARRKRANQPQR